MTEETTFALCINCEEIIAVADTERHSRQCVEVCSEVMIASSLKVYSGVQKVISFIEMELERRKGAWPRGCSLLKLAHDTLYSDTLESTEELETTLVSHRVAFSDVPSLDFMLFQRLSMLAAELLRDFQSKELKNCSRISGQQKRNFKGIEQQIERYKEKVQMYHSFLAMREKYTDSLFTGDSGSDLSEPTYFFSHEDESEQTRQANISDICSQSLREYFYTQCIAIKLHHKKTSKAQKVPIEALYQHAVESHIPVEAWPAFIRSQLQRPHTWTRKFITSELTIPEELDRSFD